MEMDNGAATNVQANGQSGKMPLGRRAPTKSDISSAIGNPEVMLQLNIMSI